MFFKYFNKICVCIRGFPNNATKNFSVLKDPDLFQNDP